MKFALEVEGLRVQLYDGPRALLADANLPIRACLVIDYHMPEIDGIELAKTLRGRNVMLPIILISGQVNTHLRTLAKQRGVTEVLEKPLSDASLVDEIRGALSPLA